MGDQAFLCSGGFFITRTSLAQHIIFSSTLASAFAAPKRQNSVRYSTFFPIL